MGGPWRKHMRSIVPTDMQARAYLSRQLAQGDPAKAAHIRSLPLFDVALNGTEAQTLIVKSRRRPR